MVSMEPFAYHETKNIDEHNQMAGKINELVADRNATANEFDAVKQTADTALADATTAQSTANGAASAASAAQSTADENTHSIATTNDVLSALGVAVNATFNNLTVSADGSTVSIHLTKVDGTEITVAMPVASAIQAGVMNPSTYSSMTGLDARVTALETKPPTYVVTLASDTPTSAEVDTAYYTQYPDAPYPALNDTTIRDPTRDISFTYNLSTSTWMEDHHQSEPIATTTILGEVLSTDGTILGKIVVESDGTMSLAGWDDHESRIKTVEDNLPLKATTMSATKASTGKITLDLKRSDGTINSTVVVNSISDENVGANEGCVITKGEYLKAKAGSIATIKPAYVVGVDALDGAAKLFPFPDDVKLENIVFEVRALSYRLIDTYAADSTNIGQRQFDSNVPLMSSNNITYFEILDNNNNAYILLHNSKATSSSQRYCREILADPPNKVLASETLPIKDGYYEGLLATGASELQLSERKNPNCHFRIINRHVTEVTLIVGTKLFYYYGDDTIDNACVVVFFNRIGD